MTTASAGSAALASSVAEKTALGGLRVVEMSTSMTGAQVGQFLADFGAEVFLVEPAGGSPLRSHPAFPLWARGKKSVQLDLGVPADRQALGPLLDTADVLVETFRPQTRERLGLQYGDVAASNPRLIHASITGFGSSGPLARIKGYEPLVMAKLGGLSAFSGMVRRKGPAYVSVPFASWSATQAAQQGILAALYEREASGSGQHVETSLAHAVGALDPWGLVVQWLTLQYPDAFRAAPPVSEDGIPNSSFTFRLLVSLTADGRWLQFSQVQPRLFRAMMGALDLDWMFDDPKWKSAPEFEDPAVRMEFWGLLLDGVRRQTFAEWQKVFEADHDVWAEVFRRGTELLYHPQMIHNGMVAEIADPDLGVVRQPGPLVRMDATPARICTAAPALDAHRHQITASDSSLAPPTGSGTSGGLPLAGVTVLELGTFYAAPFGATLLTDLGARVVKIEPLEGDPMRSILPFPESGGARVLQGKESVALDIASDDGRAIIYELARRSDLVLQCFRAGVADRLQVDAASLRAINPDLVYLNAPGYGIDGPNGHCPAFAPTIGAGAGFAWRNVGAAVPERADLDLAEIRSNSLRLTAAAGPGFAQADGVAALAVGTGLLLGLVARQRGAGGQAMLTTMLSSAAHALSEDMVEYAGRPPTPSPDPEFLGLTALYRLYETADGWIFLAAPTKRDWELLTRALAGQAALDEARFATPERRRTNDASLAEELAAVFRTRPAQDWEQDLLDAEVGCAAVAPAPVEANYLGALGRDNGYITDADHPTFGTHPRLAPLVRFSRSATTAPGGCGLGQHTNAVLSELGYSDERVAAWRHEGVIR
jgi:crotonobetainyl-CoA:carnitine CoA-transferase CaiB-like acyl-CoA transferase